MYVKYMLYIRIYSALVSEQGLEVLGDQDMIFPHPVVQVIKADPLDYVCQVRVLCVFTVAICGHNSQGLHVGSAGTELCSPSKCIKMHLLSRYHIQ